MLGVGAAGAYIPFTKIILLSDTASRPNDTLVHEMLHVICFKEQYLLPDLFEEDLARFLQDPAYQKFVKGVKRSVQSYEDSPRFPDVFIPDEYYAHIGEYLYSRRRGATQGLPEYMARHYRGILNPLLFFDKREYKDKPMPDFDHVTATFLHGDKTVSVKTRLDYLQALVRYGGVLKARERTATGIRTIRSVGLADIPEEGEITLPPKLIPVKVKIHIKLPSSRYGFHPSWKTVRMELWEYERYTSTLKTMTTQEVFYNQVWVQLSWRETQNLLNSYLSKRMEIRIRR